MNVFDRIVQYYQIIKSRTHLMMNDEQAENQLFSCSEQMTHYLHDWVNPKDTFYAGFRKNVDVDVHPRRFGSQCSRKVCKSSQKTVMEFPFIEKKSATLEKTKAPLLPPKKHQIRQVASLDKLLQYYRQHSSTLDSHDSELVSDHHDSTSSTSKNKQLKFRTKLKRTQKLNQIKFQKQEEPTIEELKSMIMKQLGKSKKSKMANRKKSD